MTDLKSRLRNLIPGVPPAPITPDAPSQISGANLTPLGEIGGRSWYSHPQLGELCQRAETWREDDRAPAPNAYLVPDWVDGYGPRFYRILDRFAPGTYEALSADAGKPVKAKASPPMLPVDALDGIKFLDPKPGLMVGAPSRTPPAVIVEGDVTNARPSPGYYREGRARVRGCEAIDAAYTKAGFPIVLSPTKQDIYIASEGGSRALEVRGHAAMLSPLMVPWKRDGVPPACILCGHPDYVEAITVAEGALPWCRRDPALAVGDSRAVA